MLREAYSRCNQRPMIPRRRADKFLHDQALDSDEGGDLLGILAVQVGQETCQIEVHMAFAGLGLKRVLIGHHEVAQTGRVPLSCG